MKIRRSWLAAFVLLILTFGIAPTMAAPAADAPARKKVKLAPYYAMLAKAAQLTGEQQTELAKLLKSAKDRKETLVEEQQQEKKDLAARYAEAVKQKDRAAIKEVRKLRGKLRIQRHQLEIDRQTDLRKLLNKEQWGPWEAARLLFGIKTSLGQKKVKLDDKQLEQVEAMCRSASIEYVKIKLADLRKQRLRRRALRDAVIKDV